jgi:hypothetical protein
MIGRSVNTVVHNLYKYRSLYDIDATRTDYEFWDRFRRGKAKGFEFSGLYAKPIAEIITSWVWGKGASAKLVDEVDDEPHRHTNELIERFFKRNATLLSQMINDEYSLADQYVVVNPDGTLSIPSPETVEPEYDILDYRRLVKVTITTRFEKVTVTDEYTDEKRVIRVKWNTPKEAGSITPQDEVTEFDNLIGRIPIVHFANDRSGNELFGRTIFEAMLHLFSKYNDLTETGLTGAELLSNPIPTIEGVEDIDETIEANQPDNDDDITDDEDTTPRMKLDRNTFMVVGKGGSFKFTAPSPGFTDDVRNMLKLLFLLIIDHSRILEAVWGSAMQGENATAKEQMKTFISFIEHRRALLQGEGADDLLGVEAVGGFLALIDIFLRIKQLTDPNVIVAPTEMIWPELTDADKKMMLDWLKWLDETGRLTKLTGLELADLPGVDADAEIKGAKEENALPVDPFDAAIDDALSQPEPEDMPEEEFEVA